MRTEEELRAALLALEREAPAAARVLPKTIIPNEQGILPRVTRHRRLAGLSAALGAAAVIGAGVAVVVALLPGARSAGHQQALPSHQVLRAKLLDALSAASGEIVYDRTTIRSDNIHSSAAGSVTESWYYPWRAKTGQLVRGRTLSLSRDGTPLDDYGVSYPEPAPAKELTVGEFTDVDYATRTWGEQHMSKLLADSDRASPLSISSLIYNALHNVPWSIVGRTEFDGHPAIELKFGVTGGASYLWIDAKTYLPLRETSSGVAGSVFGGGHKVTFRVTTREDFQYLAPTAANLAKLTVPIPPGFRRTAQLPTP